MDDPFEPELNLLEVSNKGIQLIDSITKYLSTLPHPIDVIEELISVCSVTSNLLVTLDTTITRFQPTTSHRASFIPPLCHDILVAFSQFAQKVGDAQRMGVFEINNLGLVRVPRNAWAYVMGGEIRMAQFRSRLYVEKYRVRVLIDAVAWHGLKAIGPLSRTAEEEREFNSLSRMLPLVAERLVGVLRDYKPRIENGSVTTEVQTQKLPEQVMEPQKHKFDTSAQEKMEDNKREQNNSTCKLGFHVSPSTTSIASDCSSCSTSSSITVKDDSVYERWILRYSEPKIELASKSYVLGVPIRSTYNHNPSHHYMKPLSSHPSEIQEFLSRYTATGASINKDILSLPSDAQFEIQRLTESRERASSNDKINRSFEVVAFQAQPRFKISQATTSHSKKWWKKSGKKGPVEWVLILKGETVDRKMRTTPIKHEDPWNPKPAVEAIHTPIPVQRPTISPILLQQQHLQQQQQQQQQHQLRQQQMYAAQMAARNGNSAPGAHVLRHVEQRRGLSPQEAEIKMVEILKDLLKIKSDTKGVTRGAEEVAK